ncbi:uncharacterized protein C2845_PM12G01510 [Panicum miliaceum]|uniref:Uncharacterized protein n=1 Tax=Panicum miliaceum TaxID=4540 RepID=A0A3L6QH69_PANMI|nr:uncharacterized protein C2845_PM12G01510 [Panicum miliaceum]
MSQSGSGGGEEQIGPVQARAPASSSEACRTTGGRSSRHGDTAAPTGTGGPPRRPPRVRDLRAAPSAPAAILSAWSRLRDPSSSSPAVALAALETLHLHRRALRLSSAHVALLLPLLPLHPRLVAPLLATAKDLPSGASLGSATAKNLGGGESASGHDDDDPVLAVGRILEDVEQGGQSIDDLDHLALAGIGYALASADEVQFRRILVSLLRICGRIENLAVGVRVLKLVEWLVMGFVESRRMRKVQVLFKMISPETCKSEGYVLFPVVMAACGGLRALRVASARYRLDFDPRLKEAPEQTIRFAAERVVLEGRPADDQRILVQCVTLGLTQCGQVMFHEPVLQCICMGLLKEFLPLPDILRMSVESVEGNAAEVVKAKVNQHLDSVLFKEAGPVTGVLCNHYSYAGNMAKESVETCVWEYAQEIYCHLRAAVLLHRGKQDDLITAIDKIAEASFLMVVVFAAEVTKHRLSAKSLEGFQPEVAAKILVAFSCVEHLRRLRLPEYTEAVWRAVLANQENAAAVTLFIASMPSYAELTSQPDFPSLAGTRYIWHKDEHSNEKVTSASHSVMVSFPSSGNDADQDDRTVLKEQLIFYYIKRSLEAYPGVTPFDGLASGVAAIVRHIPAGSPAILFCIHSLVVKAKDLCDTAKVQDKSLWRSWEESTEPCKKTLDLLLRLIFLVDIQSFPYLLKELAEFVTLLPKEGQDALLDDMHAHVAESDDVTRKPVLVSWLQSLSYISSQSSRSESHSKATNASSVASDELTLNRTMARL